MLQPGRGHAIDDDFGVPERTSSYGKFASEIVDGRYAGKGVDDTHWLVGEIAG